MTFRLQYWTGTLRALAERPLLGTGPANLRPFYLLHKEAAASESIAAPHNLVLDLWANGGLLAPLLAAALAWCGVTRWRTAPPSPVHPVAGPISGSTTLSGAGAGWDSLFTGALAAFGLIGACGGLLGPVAADDPNPWLVAIVRDWSWPILLSAAPAAVVLRWCGRPASAIDAPSLGPAWAAACVGLAVHLLGADGAEYPAIVVLFLLALAAPAPPAADAGPGTRRWRAAALGVGASAVAAIGLWGVLLPGRSAGGWLETARFDAALGRDPRGALQRAIEADPLSEHARAALAEVATARAVADPTDARARGEAIRLWNEALARRPRHGAAYGRLSDLHRAAGDWAAAVAADRAAVRLDPSAAAPHARLSESAARAGDATTARTAAFAALERDAVTRAAGHADRLLPEEVVKNLRLRLPAGDRPPPDGL